MEAKNIEEARKILSERLKEEMSRSYLNNTELSKESGLSRTTISRALNGHQTPTIETLYELARILGFDIKDIIYDLEYWIPIKGFQFSSRYFTEEERQEYYNELYKQIESIKSSNESTEDKNKPSPKKEAYLTKDSNDNPILKEISSDKFTVYDNSMYLLGIYKKDVISYFSKKVVEDEIEYNRIYIVKFNDDRKSMIRKIHVEGDLIISIPYPKGEHFEPECFKKDDYEGIYEIFTKVTTYY
jgi:transcriptional regulator with XRE-family HTH domain